jgi:hypothetical protein
MVEMSSHFFALAPELRNRIYEKIIQTEDFDVNLLTGSIRIPAIASTCKRIRAEFQQWYIDQAATRASIIRLHTTNFVLYTPTARGDSRDLFDTFSSPKANLNRKVIMRVSLNSDFKRMPHFWHVLVRPEQEALYQPDHMDFELRWDPANFNLYDWGEPFYHPGFLHGMGEKDWIQSSGRRRERWFVCTRLEVGQTLI